MCLLICLTVWSVTKLVNKANKLQLKSKIVDFLFLANFDKSLLFWVSKIVDFSIFHSFDKSALFMSCQSFCLLTRKGIRYDGF